MPDILSHDDLHQQLHNFVQGTHVKARGAVLFIKVAGSYGLNLATAESDVDYLGVYAAPTTEVLGLHGPRETILGEKPDYQIHEVGKFCQLLLKGNPGILEMLFNATDLAASTGIWQELWLIRRDFLTHVAVKQYLGYAKGQLSQLQKHQAVHTTGCRYNTKWAYHLIRLLQDALDIVRGQDLVPWRADGDPRRTTLLDIRAGKYQQAEVEDMASQLVGIIDRLKPWPLPEQMPVAKLNDWLLGVRRKFM